MKYLSMPFTDALPTDEYQALVAIALLAMFVIIINLPMDKKK